MPSQTRCLQHLLYIHEALSTMRRLSQEEEAGGGRYLRFTENDGSRLQATLFGHP